MLTNDATILKIKHEVLYQVAKLAYAGEFDEKKDELAYKLIPGPKPQFRCCVYKEREIVRQRVRLAEGLCPTESDHSGSKNVIQVIESACADCPLSHYIVTDNCRKCMAKACQQSCKFGAISMGRDRAYIDPDKCKECGMCAKNCPYNAIADLIRPCKKVCPVNAITMDENGICVIDEEKCIRCGQCAAKCPFGAIGTKTWITNVIADLKAGKKVYVILAPATEGQFGKDITMESWRQAVKKAGFEDLIEAGLGGDMTTCSEAEEWLEAYRNGEKKTTSCCPGFVNMIRKHYPDLADMISTTVSPMCAVSRMIKAKDPDAVTVFVGPCVAKKSEVADQKIEGNADYALNYNEILAILKAKDIELEPAENTYQDSTIFGKFYGNSGGVTDSVLEYMKETEQNEDIKVCKANGAAECKKALMFLQRGRLPEDFIEGMACEGGCVGGPSRNEEIIKARKVRETMIKSADDRKITDNLKRYDMDSFSMHR